MNRWLSWFVAGATLACTPEYPYVPTTTTTSATVVERRIDQPRGTLQVESYGVGEFTPPGETKPVTALKVRTVLTNPTDKSWTFDTREQRVEVKKQGAMAAFEVLAAAMALPLVVTVQAHDTRTVDLFYPLPATEGAGDLPGSFEVVSTVRGAYGIMTQRTALGGIGTNPSTPFWLFPFFPFGLSKAWSP